MSTLPDPLSTPRQHAPSESGWTYRATYCVRLYPAQFRQRYGAEMLQVFRHRWHKEQRDHPGT